MRITKKQQEVLRQLDKVARDLGLRLSYGDLKFAGLKLKSGQCLFKGEKWLVLDRQQPYEEQLETFREALTGFDLYTREIPDDIRKLIQQAVSINFYSPDHKS
ncbi:MAG: hypothetical protein V1742_08070 [Pseudomonadota bacterium]